MQASRTFALVALVILFAFNGVGRFAEASPRMVSIGDTAAIGNPQQIGADAMVEELNKRLAGRVAIDVRGGSTAGSENSLVAATQAGTLDVTIVTGPVVGPVVPEFGVFDVPFLFRDSAHVKAVVEGPIGTAIAAKFPEKGLVLLAIGEQGFRNVTNSKHPIQSPADLKGLKIRLLPNDIYKLTFQTLGADVVPMEFPLVYGALKDGRIDGQETPNSAILGARLQEVQKYITLTGHFFSPIAFIMNRDTFQSLDADDQQAMIAAAKAGAEAERRYGAATAAQQLAALKQGGMEVVETFDRQPFIDAVKPLEPEFEKRFGKDLLAAIRATH